MNDLFYGILTITLCTAGYIYSWKLYKENQYTAAVLLLILCGLALRVYVSADFFLHEWDERYHALVAKNLIQHPLTPTLYDNPLLSYDYRNWPANHIWIHKQPLPLWIMAASMDLFGINEIALRLPSIILSTLGIWLTYYIATYFFDRKIGYFAAFLYSINGLIIELTGGRVATDHIDIFFLFFIQLGIYLTVLFVQKQKTIFNVLAGISIGAAILSKWLPALIVLPVWLLLVMDSGKFKIRSVIFQSILLMAISTIVFLPWQLYIHRAFPVEADWESSFNYNHITQVLQDYARPVYYFVIKLGLNYGELVYIPLLWFSWITLKRISNYKRLALFIWFWVPFLFFSFVKTKMQAYILFTAPVLFMMTSEFWHTLDFYRKNHKLKWLLNLVLLLLIALPVRYMIERVKPFENRDRSPEWVADLKRLNGEYCNDCVLFNYNRPVEAMFYTNLTVYPYIPDGKIMTGLIDKGYRVIINDNGSIPDSIKAINSVILVKLNDD